MCGILCYFANKPFKHNLLAGLNNLSHRGPDAVSTQFLENGLVGLGHTRLSIVDLFGGQQPISNQEGTVFVVANGELYDYQAVRERFAASGYNFKTGSDSEIIIPLYLEYGLDLFQHLRGEFAFTLYDSVNQRVIAARDRFGIKPLYYHKNDHGLFVGSEVKSILPFDIQRSWNLDAVLYGDSFIPNQSQTCFQNIYALKPGHYLVFEGGKLEEKCYWDIDYSVTTQASEEGLIAEFKSTLVEAVKQRLHGDVPVACYVSGGLDSTSILSIVSKELGYKTTSFNIAFDDSNYDESALSKHVASYLGIEYVPVQVNSDNISDNFRAAVYHNEGLIYNNQTVAKYILSRAVHNAGFKVVLTGEGADEILAGYPFFREDVIRYHNNTSATAEALDSLRNNNKQVSHVFLSNEDATEALREVEAKLGYIPSMWRVGASYRETFAKHIYKDSLNERFSGRNPYLELLGSLDLNKIKGMDPVNSSLYLWAKTNLPEVILSFLGDRMEMANSIEGRLPFLDHKVAEFCHKLPINLKIRGQTEKYILREALKDIIPKEIYQRQKFPFTAPPVIQANGAKNKLTTMMFDVLHSNSARDLPFYDRDKFLGYIEFVKLNQPEHVAKLDPILNRVVSAATLAEEFKIGS